MKKILSYSFRIACWIFACVLILTSLLLFSARALSEYVEDYASNIVDGLSMVLGVPLEVDSVAAAWHGLGPLVVLKGVRLGEGEELSTISSVTVKPDVVASLLAWGVIWSRFEVSEMDVQLRELPSGRWEFAGIELGGDGGGAYLEEMVLESNRIAVQQASFSVHTLIDNEVVLNVRDMQLDYYLGFHRLKLDADFGGGQNQLTFIAELTGTAARFFELDGLAYLKIDGRDISGFFNGLMGRLMPGRQFNLNQPPSSQIELWANFRGGDQIGLQGSAILSGMPARLFGDEPGSFRVVTDLSGVYSNKVQSLDLQNTELEFYSDRVQLPDLQLVRAPGKGEVDYSLMVPSIQISELLDSLAEFPVSGANSEFRSGLEQILALNPFGEISSLRIEVPDLEINRWRATGQLQSVHVDSYWTAPAVKNLSGYFSIHGYGGSMQVDAEDISLFYPKVYEHWLEHESVKGLVSWQLDIQDKALLVYSSAISVTGEHGPVKGAFLADIPLWQPDHPRGVDLTLFGGIQDTSVEQKDMLIPDSVSRDLRSWLDGALLEGSVPGAGFVHRGSTKRSQPDKRTTQLRLETVNAELHYADRWPNVTDLAAQVWVSDARVTGVASSAKLLDLELTDIRIAVEPDQKAARSRHFLRLDSLVQGRSASMLDLIRTTELRDRVGASLDGLNLDGLADASVSLGLPIEKGYKSYESYKRKDIDIQVRASVLNNRLLLVDENLQLEAIDGVLTYGKEGLNARGLQAKAWGRPLEIDLTENQNEGILAIDLQGALDVGDIAEWLDLTFLDRLQGIADVSGRVEVVADSTGDLDKTYHFKTDLRGVTSTFPEPFSKSADEATSLAIKSESGELKVTSIDWDTVAGDSAGTTSATSEFLLEISQYPGDESGFHSARLSFQSDLPERREGVFSGRMHLANLDLDEYFEVYRPLVAALSTAGRPGVYGTILGLRPDVTLRAERFTHGATNFGDIKATLAFEPEAWKVNLDAGYGRGSLFVFEDKNKLPLVDIATLDAGGLAEFIVPGEQENMGGLIDPKDMPPLQVRVGSVTLDDIERGRWSGILEPTEKGLWIGDLNGGLDSALLSEEEGSSKIFWGLDSSGYYTEMDLTFDYGDIGDLFGLFGMNPPMNSSSGIFYTSLNWRGAPYELSKSGARGLMGIHAQDGSFHTGDSKVPNTLLKTIGLINVGSWVRRLRLDFEDMKASGTAYDRIVGDFIIADDRLSTLTPVDIELSSGSMLFDGAIDLGEETVEARLVMTLPARQNVTWVAALVAGLPAAVGVWLAGKIFDDELDSLSSVSYKVEGSLDDLSVSAEKMFESTITQ